jgi:hypothetical protein
VHGSSNSARTSFDRGPERGSIPSWCIRRYGYDVWTMDHDGYSHSAAPVTIPTWPAALPISNPPCRCCARPDAQFILRGLVRRDPPPPSAGTPDAVDRLVLVAFTYKGTGSPTLRDCAKQVEFYRPATAAPGSGP